MRAMWLALLLGSALSPSAAFACRAPTESLDSATASAREGVAAHALARRADAIFIATVVRNDGRKLLEQKAWLRSDETLKGAPRGETIIDWSPKDEFLLARCSIEERFG